MFTDKYVSRTIAYRVIHTDVLYTSMRYISDICQMYIKVQQRAGYYEISYRPSMQHIIYKFGLHEQPMLSNCLIGTLHCNTSASMVTLWCNILHSCAMNVQ